MATVGEYFDFQNGFAFKSKDFLDEGPYKVIRIKELKEGSIRFFGDTAYIDPQKGFDTEKYIVNKGDVLFALTGDPVSKPNPLSWVGRVSFYDHDEPALLNQRVCKAVPKGEMSSEFLYYFFRQYKEFYSLAAKATGSASQANISTKTIQEHEWTIPDILAQQKIVSVLRCIDKKIQNNSRINEKLLDLLQALYSNLQQSLPGDSEAISLTDNRIGSVLKAKINKYDGKKAYIATADVSGQVITNRTTKLAYDERPSRANMQPKEWTLWFAKMKDSPKLIFINDKCPELVDDYIFSTGFCGIETSPELFYYLWAYLSSEGFDTIKNAYCGGTTMQALNNDGLAKITVKLPSKEALSEFSAVAEILFNKIHTNILANEQLISMRDSMLPRLISGELDPNSIQFE